MDEKEKTIYFVYRGYEDFLWDLGKILKNKDLWNELGDDRTRLDKVEIIIRHPRALIK